MNARVFVAIVLLLSGSYSRAAEPVCYQYRSTFTFFGAPVDSGWHSTPAGACAAAASMVPWPVAGYTGGSLSAVVTSAGPPIVFVCEGTRYYSGGHEFWGVGAGDSRINPTGCPPDPCDVMEGLTAEGGAPGTRPEVACQAAVSGFVTGSAPGIPVGMCKWRPKGPVMVDSTGWYSKGIWEGGSCEVPNNTRDAPNCKTGPGGQFCIEKQDSTNDGTNKQCGSYNGEYVCLDKVPPGQCTLTPNGAAVCHESAAAPPGPSVEGGGAMTPGLQVDNTADDGSTTTFNFYSSTQVASSVAPVMGSSNPVGNDPNGTGTVTPVRVVGGSTGSGDGEGESIDDLAGGEMGEVGGFGESLNGFWSAIQGAPLIAAVSAIPSALGAGTCPIEPEMVDAGELSFEMDLGVMCTLWDQIAPTISAVMLCIWAIVGIRILMSA